MWYTNIHIAILFSLTDFEQVQDIKLETVSATVEQTQSNKFLENYCEQKNFDKPKYSCICSKSKKFVGEVCVEGVIYSTYPMEYSQKSIAENAAAEVALENIKEFPISRDSCEEQCRKIYGCLKDNGIFLKYLPNIFE